MLDRILREFDAEELLNVELIPQFQDQASPKVIAGKGRENPKRVLRHNDKNQGEAFEDGGTIACVTGFLLNMVDQTLSLISPCTASDKWPLGYIVFGRWYFRNASEFRDALRSATTESMQASLREHDEVRFQPSLSLQGENEGFRLANRYYSLDFSSLLESRHLAQAIESGGQTVGEIAEVRYKKWGIPHLWTHQALSVLLNEAVLCDPLTPIPEHLHVIAAAGD